MFCVHERTAQGRATTPREGSWTSWHVAVADSEGWRACRTYFCILTTEITVTFMSAMWWPVGHASVTYGPFHFLPQMPSIHFYTERTGYTRKWEMAPDLRAPGPGPSRSACAPSLSLFNNTNTTQNKRFYTITNENLQVNNDRFSATPCRRHSEILHKCWNFDNSSYQWRSRDSKFGGDKAGRKSTGRGKGQNPPERTTAQAVFYLIANLARILHSFANSDSVTVAAPALKSARGLIIYISLDLHYSRKPAGTGLRASVPTRLRHWLSYLYRTIKYLQNRVTNDLQDAYSDVHGA